MGALEEEAAEDSAPAVEAAEEDGDGIVRLRTLPAEPASGDLLRATWEQTLCTMVLWVPVSQGVTRSDVEVLVGTEALILNIDGKKDKEFSNRLGGAVVPSRCSWTYQETDSEDGQAYVVIYFVKRTQTSWKSPFSFTFEGSARVACPWTKAQEENMATVWREPVKLEEGSFLKGESAENVVACASDLILGLDASQDKASITVEVHFDWQQLLPVLDKLLWEELVAVDISSSSIVIFLQTDPGNPILHAHFSSEVAPEYSTWRIGSSNRFQWRQEPLGKAVPMLTVQVWKQIPKEWTEIFSEVHQHELMSENQHELQDLYRALEEDVVCRANPGMPVLTEEELFRIQVRIEEYASKAFPGLSGVDPLSVYRKGCYEEHVMQFREGGSAPPN